MVFILRDVRVLMAFSITLLMFLSLSCGQGISRPSRIPLTPAESIDPFAYGDEFNQNTSSAILSSNSLYTDSQPDSTQTVSESEQTQPYTAQNTQSSVPDAVLYRVQLGGVFENKDEADSYARRIRNRVDGDVNVEYRAPFYRVYAGNFNTQREAEAYILFLQNEGIRESRWVPERPIAQ